MSDSTGVRDRTGLAAWQCSRGHANSDDSRFCGKCREKRSDTEPGVWRCSRGHVNSDDRDFCGTCGEKRSDSTELWRGLTARAVEAFLWLGIALLVGVVVAIFVHSIYYVIDRNDHDFAELSQLLISNVLLIFIVLELIEIAQHQIGRRGARRDKQESDVFSPYLGKVFLRMLLIVGVLSSVRHLLIIGAELTTSTRAPDSHTLWELGVTAGVVLVLVGGLILVSSYYHDPSGEEAKYLEDA